MKTIGTMFKGKGVEEIADILRENLQKNLHLLYGQDPDPRIVSRLQDEWDHALNPDHTEGRSMQNLLSTAALFELSQWLKEDKIPYWCAGAAGCSLLLYLLGITAVNPLPPHCRCSKCGKTVWMSEENNGNKVRDGFDADLPERYCPDEDEPMIPDGHDLPWIMLWGSNQIDSELLKKNHLSEVNFEIRTTSGAVREIREHLDQHWIHYFYENDEFEKTLRGNENMLRLPHIILNCHMKKDLNPDFYQRQFGIAAWKTYLKNGSWKDDIKRLCEDPSDAYPDLKEILDAAPDVPSFSELVYIYGMNSSTGVWNETIKSMLKDQECHFNQLLTFREDDFSYFQKAGCPDEEAWYCASLDSRGKKDVPSQKSEEKEESSRILEKFHDKKPFYLFPKAHVIEYLFFQIRAC